MHRYTVPEIWVVDKDFGLLPWAHLLLKDHNQSSPLQNVICTVMHPQRCCLGYKDRHPKGDMQDLSLVKVIKPKGKPQGCITHTLLQIHTEDDDSGLSQEKVAEMWCLLIFPPQNPWRAAQEGSCSPQLFPDNHPARLSHRQTISFIWHSNPAT